MSHIATPLSLRRKPKFEPVNFQPRRVNDVSQCQRKIAPTRISLADSMIVVLVIRSSVANRDGGFDILVV